MGKMIDLLPPSHIDSEKEVEFQEWKNDLLLPSHLDSGKESSYMKEKHLLKVLTMCPKDLFAICIPNKSICSVYKLLLCNIIMAINN